MDTARQLFRDFALTAPEAHVIATHWVNSAKGFKKNTPAIADLAEMLTGVGNDLTMQGAPQLEIDLVDEDWLLLDSGFFSPSRDGILDRVEINYPEGSRYHWVLFQISPKADFTVQTYWVPRVVIDLMNLHGPFSANRASRTRAEFLKMCADKVQYAHFYSKQLTIKQPIAPITLPTGVTAQDTSTKGPKSVGLTEAARKRGGHKSVGQIVAGVAKGTGGTTPRPSGPLTIGGAPMTSSQKDILDTALKVADQLGAGQTATVAMVYAAMGESNVSKESGGGVWQDTSSPNPDNVANEARAFLTGLYGFASTGAIGIAAGKGTYNQGQPTTDAVYVANATELNKAFLHSGRTPGNYSDSYGGHLGGTQSALKEAEAIVEAGGGATGAGGVQSTELESVQQYNFTIGTTQSPHEDYWTGMNRLAQEVNWELVVDGDDIYYDSDVTLCRMAIEAVIDRTDEPVADWSYDWDRTQLPTNFQLVLECDPFQFRAADVFKLARFGPASAGSSIKLPGRWLVGEIQRNPGDIVSTFTLVQPTQPLSEPAPTVVTSTSSGAGGAAAVGTYAPASVLAAIQAAQRLSKKDLPYSTQFRTLTKKPPAGGYDCSAGVSWVLLTAGFPLPGNASWGSWAPVSGDFETWGKPGPGKQMTIWCSSHHIFIEFHVPNIGHVGFDSGHMPAGDPWFQTLFHDTSYTIDGTFTPRHWPGT